MTHTVSAVATTGIYDNILLLFSPAYIGTDDT